MKKIAVVFLIISILSFSGCIKPSEKELAELKAQIISLEEQLNICKNKANLEDDIQWDGNDVNHNDNTVIKP
ncbi:MAG: hypothetical protein KKD32_03775 [Proteobacteria bacterium]|nr:hypothetical protein [Pseudomonadota bacterium]MBU1586280.1 hypothetical protein [Pseudomonadota bacterium]MBU2453176.1 hypothetical protein [Pseudomonadota bacterium]MBU2630793.1 hypothetical protein [Pseudomonadota bacterium]